MSDDDKLRNALRPGHKLHWYQIERVLGQGGFGITYLAYDTNLDQQVAIKEYLPMELAVREGDFSVYPASQTHDDRYKWGLDRFLSEARTLARFRHEAIVRVLSVFEANNTAYMVMEYQRGMSLQELLDRRGSVPEEELVAMVVPLLDGLEVIHAQGFIHRDIKPSNIFIHSDGHPVLLDFGSARQALGEETRTLTSVVSPGYAPFEQYYSKSDRQGPWTDIYGLGATLYRAISGLQPMAAIDRSEAILKAERDVFVSASEIGSEQYSRSFLSAIDAALEFNEKKRPQSVAEWRPYFDFSTTVETLLNEPLHTEYPDNAPTRFSAIVEPTVKVDAGEVRNPDARAPNSAERRARQGRSEPRSEPRSGPRTREQGEPRSEPRSRPQRRQAAAGKAPASGQPRAGGSTSGRAGAAARQPRRAAAAEPAPATGAVAPRPRRWPLWLLLVLVLGVGATAVGQHLGFLPGDMLAGVKAGRLVKLGDRALAAGDIYDPERGSALDFYRRAYQRDPGHEDARHGLSLAAKRLAEAIAVALDGGELDRARSLYQRLDGVPPAVFDPAELRARYRAMVAEETASTEIGNRVRKLVDAAAADVAAGNLLGPGTDNALARYRAVQVLDPDNVDAREGLVTIATALADKGQSALAADDLEAALEWHGQATLLAPQAVAVVALGEAVRQAREAVAAAGARSAEIERLLAAADADLAGNRLTSPAGENAFEKYRSVLARDPGNQAARDGINRIHDRYIALATQALTNGEFASARQLAGRAESMRENSEPAQTLKREIAAAEARADAAESQRLAVEAQERAAQAAAARATAERARREREAERRRREQAERDRLQAEAEARAKAEIAAREAAKQARVDAANAEPRLVVDFKGFHPKYGRNGLTRDILFRQVQPVLIGGGYKLVTRGDVHDANYSWTNVRVLVYVLRIGENTATGQYSYNGGLYVYPGEHVKKPLSITLDTAPDWDRSHNGLGPPDDLKLLLQEFVGFTRAFVEGGPPQRR